MAPNQYPFEIVRDVATLLLQMRPGDTLTLTVTAKPHSLMDWQSSRGEPCGWSETSCAMHRAYIANHGSANTGVCRGTPSPTAPLL